jgi:hypothetical protein
MHGLIAVEPLPTKDILVDSEGEIQDSDVSMEDVSDSDYAVKEWRDWKLWCEWGGSRRCILAQLERRWGNADG